MRRGARDVTIFYLSTLLSTLNFDLKIFGFRKERGKKEEVQYFETPTGLKMGTFLAPSTYCCARAAHAGALGTESPRVQLEALKCPLAPSSPRPASWPRRPPPPQLTAESGEGVGAPPSRPRRRRRQYHGPRHRCRCPWSARSPRALFLLQTFGFCD